MKISMIVATDSKGGIGVNDSLPWNNIPEDMKFFKSKTKGKPCVMGRKTFDSIVKAIGKPLPDRFNIVLTHNDSTQGVFNNVVYVKSPKEAIEQAIVHSGSNDDGELMVIGGGLIYDMMYPLIDRVYHTRINKSFLCDVHISETIAKIYDNFIISEIQSIYDSNNETVVMFTQLDKR